jgi:methyl-accepting chemotaxis protein
LASGSEADKSHLNVAGAVAGSHDRVKERSAATEVIAAIAEVNAAIAEVSAAIAEVSAAIAEVSAAIEGTAVENAAVAVAAQEEGEGVEVAAPARRVTATRNSEKRRMRPRVKRGRMPD